MKDERLYYNFKRAERKAMIFHNPSPKTHYQKVLYWPLKIFLRKIYWKIFKGEKRILLNTKTFWGESMWITLPENEDIFFTGILGPPEIPVIAFLMKVLPNKKTFFDIGANYGFYTLLARRIMEKGEVHSFEPTPMTFKILKSNIGNRTGIFINKIAISDKIGVKDLFLHPRHSGINTFYKEIRPDQYGPNPKRIKVPTITIDDYCKEKNIIPDVIKMDIEGGEYDALLGASTILKNDDIQIIMELGYKPLFNNNFHIKAVKILANFGFHPFKIDKNGNLFPFNFLLDELKNKYDEKNQSENILFRKW